MSSLRCKCCVLFASHQEFAKRERSSYPHQMKRSASPPSRRDLRKLRNYSQLLCRFSTVSHPEPTPGAGTKRQISSTGPAAAFQRSRLGRRLHHDAAAVVDAMEQWGAANLAEIGVDRLALALVVAIVVNNQNPAGHQSR